MRFENQEQTTKTPVQSPSLERFIIGQAPQFTDEPKTVAAERASQTADEYFEFVARATNDAVRDWHVTTGELSWPHGLGSLLGYEPGSADAGINFWQNNLHPSDRHRVASSINEAFANNTDHWSGEYRFRRADGADVNILERALILRDENGAAVRLIGSMMDITARKQLHDQLCRSQRMEAFGQLAAGVAHDFNNFLTTILGYGDLLLQERQIKGTLADHVTEIRAAAGRASALTQQLLAFSRRQAMEPVVVEVNSIITNLERSLLRLIGENISVVCHLHNQTDGAYIRADTGKITQIILNLAVNARDAMPQGGELVLTTGVANIPTEPQCPIDCKECDPGEYVVISVTDTGTGMNEEVKAHLFEPFFTT